MMILEHIDQPTGPVIVKFEGELNSLQKMDEVTQALTELYSPLNNQPMVIDLTDVTQISNSLLRAIKAYATSYHHRTHQLTTVELIKENTYGRTPVWAKVEDDLMHIMTSIQVKDVKPRAKPKYFR